MNIKTALNYIYSPNYQEDIASLEKMAKIMAYFDNPQDKLKIIHVAGTNGKGSYCASIASILKEANYKVGMFTSPHLVSPSERFIINGKLISDKDFCKYTLKVKQACTDLKVKPTVFEKLTAIAFLYFYAKKVDVLVLEVGLGGLLDSTNIIKKPILAAIMNIGYDHTEILGNTLSKIAKQKAGIIKKGINVVGYNNSKSIIKEFIKASNKSNAKLTLTDPTKLKIISEGIDNQEFNYKKYKNIKLSLLGKHQFLNALVVLDSIDILNKKGFKISLNDVREGFIKTDWPARLSILSREPLFIMDGAHNPQCGKALAQSLPKILANKKAIMLCGVLKDKDYESLFSMLIPYALEFVCITPNSYRALKASDLAKYLSSKGKSASVANSINNGIKIALRKANKQHPILAFGSLYLAGDIKKEYMKISNTK